MIHEYALDPVVLLAWASNDRDYAEFLREYGLGTPRIFSSFPAGKAAKLRSYFLRKGPAVVDSLQGRRYVEMVTKLAEVVVLRNAPEIQGDNWGALAEGEHKRLPFDVILSAETINSERNITPANMYADGSIWNHPGQLNIQRTNEGFCTAIASLLRLATQRVVVIDAYGWTTKAIIQMQYLIQYTLQNHIDRQIPPFTLFFKKSDSSPSATYVKSCIFQNAGFDVANIELNVFELEDVQGHDVFHNRCILTEHGAVKTGHGIGVSGDQAHTDEAFLVNRILYEKECNQFIDDSCFKIVSQA